MKRDKEEVDGWKVPGKNASVCGTPLQWVDFGLCHDVYAIKRLHSSLDNLFSQRGMDYHLSEFILMDITLNCQQLQQNGTKDQPPPLSAILMLW
jgi:hypothetical protein